MWLHHPNLRDNVRQEMLPVFDRYFPSMVEDMEQDVAQNGRLKYEGSFKQAFFRTIKMYSLVAPPDAESKSQVRAKGIPAVAAKQLGMQHFNPSPTVRGEGGDEIVSAWGLRSTAGLEMSLSVHTRKLPGRVNFKRKALVIPLQTHEYEVLLICLFFLLLGTIPFSSLALMAKPGQRRFRGRKRHGKRKGGPPQQYEFENVTDVERIKAALSRTFERRLKLGVIMSNKELAALAQKKGIHISTNHLLAFKSGYPSLRRFQEIRTSRPAAFQTILRARYGTLMIDTFFMPEKRANSNYVGAMLAVEIFTNQLAAVPLKRRTIEAYENAIQVLFSESIFRQISVILSDRERAMFSKLFAKNIRKKYNIKIVYMRTRSKAYLTERMIRYVKTRLSAAKAANNTSRWLDFLKPVIDEYNKRRVLGTSFRRADVDANNLHQFLEEKYDIADYTSLVNISRVDGRSIENEGWLKSMFKYNVGDSLLVSLKLLQSGRFPKPSVHGYFSQESYIVTERYLATTKRLTLVPGLTSLNPCHAFKHKLILISFFQSTK